MTTEGDPPTAAVPHDEAGPSQEAVPPEEALPPEDAGPGRRRGGALAGVLQRIPHPRWRRRRGLMALFFVIAGIGAAAAVSGVMTMNYTETTSFCGRCHTMGPELKAYQLSSHREVACAQCHVEPGLAGFVKAKANGTKQLIEMVTGSYPTPIPPPDHASLPPVKDTCLKCHSMQQITENGGPLRLVLRPTYQSDEKNTRELVAVILRPSGLGSSSGNTVGVHWHVQQKVTYSTDQPSGAQKIDLVEVTRQDGSQEQYVSSAKILGSTDITKDVNQLKAGETTRTMDCLDCHNRVGHTVPNVGQAIDQSIASGAIPADLPYVKRESAALLGQDYASTQDADAAIAGLRTTYQQRYPLLSGQNGAQLDRTVTELQRLYRELATPEMKVQAQTYPNNLGHQTSPGCFRCHDGRHVQVVNGKPTGKVIPSTCSTCHTFPQVGGQISGILLGGAPVTHTDPLYVFNHKKLATGPDPTGTSCGQCHQRAYCQNCHDTGAVKVTHDQMLYNHAGAIRVSGGQACAYCHQPVYCATCHGKTPVLDAPSEPADRARIGPAATP
jgi:nitrate/TMAO reductase-like tetraheme cytochrome c subunit